MPEAVQFDRYGGVEVLEVRDVERPVPGAGEVLVRVKAAGINPGESMIREGALADRWPSTFPSGQGSDLAGVVEEVADGVQGFAVGDEVFGWTDERRCHAELVAVPAEHLATKPASVSWEVAGSLFVAGLAAYASVQAVAPKDGEVVVVSAAAGGVGTYAVQLARLSGATVIGLASERNHAWLHERGIIAVTHGDGVEERILEAAAGEVSAFIDLFGGGYVDLAIELGVPAERINTVIDFAAAERHGVSVRGSSEVADAAVLREVVGRVATKEVEVPIAATYPLVQVQDAYRRLADRTTHGKIVLVP
jgi:NADPH:quinone reductase-like Zn-dependent oxidoreductase